MPVPRTASTSNVPQLERPSPLRRWGPLALIVCLHLGLFQLLQNGLLHRMVLAVPENLIPVTIIAAPPAPPVPPVPPPAASPVQAPAPKKPPVVRERTPPRPRPEPKPPAQAAPQLKADTADSDRPAPTAPTVQEPSAPVTAPAAPAAAQPVAAPAPATPKTLTSGVQYVQAPRPDYPVQSKRLGEEGKVILRALINAEGRVERIEIQRSSGHPRLDDAAREAVQNALFRPHLEDGRPVKVYAIVPISFRLDQ